MTGRANQDRVTTSLQTPLYFRGAYDEAFELLVRARNYVEHAVPALKYSAEPPDPLSVTTETLRLTARLTQVMAWLLAQRAVHAGEIGADDFIDERYRLEGQSVCLKQALEEFDDLPDGLCDLMEESYDLYRRILRLDEQFVRASDPRA